MLQYDSRYLLSLSDEDKAQAWSDLARGAREVNGEALAYLRSRVRKFELRYEMTSEELLKALKEDRQRETAEIAEWLFLLSALERHGEEARR